VRELEDTIERAVILSRNGVLTVDPEMLRDCSASATDRTAHSDSDDEIEERTAIENV
jgi:hypothetical protein